MPTPIVVGQSYYSRNPYSVAIATVQRVGWFKVAYRTETGIHTLSKRKFRNAWDV